MDEVLAPPLWASLATITAVWLVTVISPGPNFLATAHAALSQSRRSGVLVAAGIAVGTTLWATVSLAGLGLLFQSAGWLYAAVKLAGGAYLIYLGLRTIAAAHRRPAVALPSRAPLTGRQAFRRGLLTDLANPKAAAFFTSLFAVAVPPTAPLWFDAAVVALVVAMAGGWYAVVACAMTAGPIPALYRRAERAIGYLTGAVFIGLGARLASER